MFDGIHGYKLVLLLEKLGIYTGAKVVHYWEPSEDPTGHETIGIIFH